MRCFACNLDLPDSTSVDRPTLRFYCTACMELTIEVMLMKQEIELERVLDINPTSFVAIADVLSIEGWNSLDELDLDIEEESKEEWQSGG